MTLRAAVNLLWCVPGEVGGSEEYLVRQLGGAVGAATSAGGLEVTVFASRAFADAHAELGSHVTFVAPRADMARRPVRVLTEHTWLAARTERRAPGGRAFDLVHHGGGTAPVVGARPVVLTVHDLQYLDHPEYVSERKLRYLRAVVPRSVARAAVVTTPSEFVRSTVVEHCGADPERVVVVPHGVPVPDVPTPVDESELRRRYGLGSGPVLVYPAITHPHKRHELLLDALDRHWTDPDLRLVLLGGRGRAEAVVEARIAALGHPGRVVRPGRVPDHDRDALIAIADALVFPSGYEGFGAPLIEAMALGTPVVCGDHPAVVEVVGDAAVVLADDVEAWADVPSIVRARRSELVRAGRRRVESYRLERSGQALLEAYRRAVAS